MRMLVSLFRGGDFILGSFVWLVGGVWLDRT